MQPRDPLAGRIRLYRFALILGIAVSLLLAAFCYERGLRIRQLEAELQHSSARVRLAERFRRELDRQKSEMDAEARMRLQMIRQATLSEMRARDMQIQAMQAAREAEIRLRQAEQRQERQSGR